MKRLFDFISVIVFLPILLPIILIICLLIRKSSAGPILFVQERIGFRGETFQVYKFRTMVKNAAKLGTSVTAGKDPRITPIGSILRKTKLDELPQLFNVLKGDMSLVGPRPDVEEIVNKYTPHMMRVFNIRPGITSLATLHLRDEESILEHVKDPDLFYDEVLVPLKVKLGMEHVDRNSFKFDLKILCETIWMLLFGRWFTIKEHAAISELKNNISLKGKREQVSSDGFMVAKSE